MPTSSYDLSIEALAYASRGFLIFPLWHVRDAPRLDRLICACDDGPDCGSPGKHPRTRRGLTEASSDKRLVEKWWSMWPHANIGMPMGANGLAAIDVDPDHGGDHTLATLDQYCVQHECDLWSTRVNRTGSGGTHHVFRDPRGIVPTKRQTFGSDAPGVDTRGRGGYIVAPPSLHASGNRYEVIHNGHTLADWPDCLTPLLSPAPPTENGLPPGAIACGPTRATDGDLGAVWAFHALLSETKQLADLPLSEGSGKNAALNTAAYKLGRRVGAGFIDEPSVAIALFNSVSHWIGHGHTERELRATIRSGVRAGMLNPHPGPATRGAAR